MAKHLADRLIVLGLAAGVMVAPVQAGAVTWKVLFEPGPTLVGTFEADASGGVVSNPSIFWGGVLYDTPYPTEPPSFDPAGDPVLAPFGYVGGPGGGGYGWFWNSTAMGDCAALSCTLGLSYNGAYGEYFTGTGFMPTDSFDEGTGSGEYSIAPVPVPAGLLLLISALAGIGVVGRVRPRA